VPVGGPLLAESEMANWPKLNPVSTKTAIHARKLCRVPSRIAFTFRPSAGVNAGDFVLDCVIENPFAKRWDHIKSDFGPGASAVIVLRACGALQEISGPLSTFNFIMGTERSRIGKLKKPSCLRVAQRAGTEAGACFGRRQVIDIWLVP
jgi:hypothetical protein